MSSTEVPSSSTASDSPKVTPPTAPPSLLHRLTSRLCLVTKALQSLSLGSAAQHEASKRETFKKPHQLAGAAPLESGNEQRQLAAALARGPRATVLAFHSPRCRLCRSLAPVAAQLRQRHGAWLAVVGADVEDPQWLPEVAHLDIRFVPCFVLLDSRGRALAKTGVPASRRHVLKGLYYLVESLRPREGRARRGREGEEQQSTAETKEDVRRDAIVSSVTP